MIKYTVQVDKNGTKSWYVDSKRHRVDGPAVEWSDGTKYWYVNDKRHRIDGPAIEDANGTKMWFVDGVSYTEAEFDAKVQSINK